MNVERMPFDQYQRYRLVCDLLGTLRGKQKLEVLDVGGRTALLRGFLTKDRVTLVDLESSAEPGLVLGDGAKLPFRDKSFDVVAAFDTLEHVPPKLRAAFVAECARVSRGYVVLAGPYHTERVAEAEKILQRFLKEKLGEKHRYLEEHRHNGLPSREKTEAQLEKLGAKVQSFGHANLERWLAMMCLSLYLDQDPALRGLATRVHEFYNRALYASDHAEPVYRHVVVAAFSGARLPSVENILAPPRAPAGALEPFTELTGELVAFDRERDAWREERLRLASVNRDLAKDLEGHTATLAEIESELELERKETLRLHDLLASERDQSSSAIAVLEADLQEHRRSLDLLNEETAKLRHEYVALERLAVSEREQAEKSIETLEADLAGHMQSIKDVLGEASEQLVAFERERGNLGRIIGDLEQDLGGHRESLAHCQREIQLREEYVAGLIQDATEQRKIALESIALLQAELA
ncbi:MAG TPA: methyltransferase domain-containing protein, partial [Planctomycetota bacterium]|nr:methyltransferase domain-containing protein [Planctomycetota bacterium]